MQIRSDQSRPQLSQHSTLPLHFAHPHEFHEYVDHNFLKFTNIRYICAFATDASVYNEYISIPCDHKTPLWLCMFFISSNDPFILRKVQQSPPQHLISYHLQNRIQLKCLFWDLFLCITIAYTFASFYFTPAPPRLNHKCLLNYEKSRAQKWTHNKTYRINIIFHFVW